jgi:hypothetical protein
VEIDHVKSNIQSSSEKPSITAAILTFIQKGLREHRPRVADGLREANPLIEQAVNPCRIARGSWWLVLAPAPFPAIRVLPRIAGRFGVLPEQHEDLADVLNRLRSGASADLRQDRLALGAIGTGNAHFDQLVALQGAVDFREDRGRESSSADLHDWVERVRPRFQLAPPSG